MTSYEWAKARRALADVIKEARREGYEEARIHAEQALYGGLDDLFAWLSHSTTEVSK